MKPCQAVVLFAHGARDARWSESLQALADAIQAQLAQASVRTAFLELQSPTLPEALEAAAADGAQRIDIVPVFWAGAGHIDHSLPPIIAAFARRHPNVDVRALPVLSELPGLLDFVANAVAQSVERPTGS
jgi:sirohydrochlorin cobaltochelatase